MSPLRQWDLEGELRDRRLAGTYRRRHCLQSPQAAQVRLAGRTLVNFSSNDYLGLAADPRLAAALTDAARRWGVGGGASQLVSGHSAPHRALEDAIAAYTGRARAVLFSSGYLANLGVATTLLRRGDAIFMDRLSHASLVDAARLSGARLRRYRHRDWAHLDHLLSDAPARRALVVSDGLFSMDGDLAPLDRLLALTDRHRLDLVVDDAHGLGVLGDSGRGTEEVYGVVGQVPVLVGTFGKAFGGFGAFVAGGEELIETLLQGARSLIYTTAPPPAVAAATAEGLRLAAAEPWRRARLTALIQRFRLGAAERALPVLSSTTPIQGVPLGDNHRCLAVAAHLEARGFLVVPIRAPTVPRGGERLRITLTAGHSEDQVDALLDALQEAL